MTWQEAKAIFEKEMPELTVTMVTDYDKRHYFIEAVEDPYDEEGEFDPAYAVDKKTKKVCSMNVTYDLEKWFESIEKRLKYRFPYK